MNKHTKKTASLLQTHCFSHWIRRSSRSLLMATLFGIGSATTNASENHFLLSTAHGNGANAWTNANDGDPQGSVAQMALDSSALKIRRGNAKTYLRFDLDSVDLSGFGAGNLFEQGLWISAVTVRLEQADPLRASPLDLYGINLNRDWTADGRLGIDWDQNQITHLNAPASGSGGSFSTADERSFVFGSFTQSVDFRFHTYTESSGDAQTPLLNYLNGISISSNTTTLLRTLGVRESGSGPNNTDNFFTRENTTVMEGNALAPTLELTIIPEPRTYALLIGIFLLGGGLFCRRLRVKSYGFGR